MMAYTIDAALESGIFPSVIVSTEDDEIGAIAESLGAVYHRRPMDLAGDLVSSTDVCIEAYEKHAKTERVDGIVCLQPSSPLRSASDVRESWQKFVDAGADYLVSVTPIDPHYFHWAVHETETGWQMWFRDEFMKERPLLPPVFRPNGAIKIGRPGPMIARRNFFGPNLQAFDMPEERSIHVATEFDAIVAAAVLRRAEDTR
jgi:CMP-N-acetylneuraminic acid synthetase